MISTALLKKQKWTIAVLAVLIFLTIGISLTVGSAAFAPSRLLPTLFGNGSFTEEFILYSVRLPRIIVTLLAGIALSLSGAILQGITRNDLADPGIIGINAGAGVAVAIFFLFFPIDAGSFIYMIPVCAFIGAVGSALLIYVFSYDKNLGFQPTRLVLVGVGFSMALSGIMVVLINSAEREKVEFISKWLAGNVWGTDWPYIIAMLPWLIICIPFTLYKANKLDVLTFSEPVAVGIGASIQKERISLAIVAVAMAAAAVSATGSISFIGLMGPHIAKALVGPRHKLYLPIALLVGGLFLLAADTIGKNILDPDGIPAGIMAAIIGAPYFMYLLFKKK
ncbi:iron ABC transporter permease [Niallia circulans]|uniref:Iron ABC transporter permease n=1 Tax=Niallia circulans TaxID=1397 RepID=A0A553SHV2_NIACI|nr:iron ABC transporter permease [Niallia circulans]TRZ36563.1 iron ABC transporter permease [Niallia circulans]